MAIQSFQRKEIENFFLNGGLPKSVGWRQQVSIVRRKLDMLHFAKKIEDLRSPPGNRLELLKGKWSGYYSVRVNDQWRIVFQWAELGPSQVDVCDYH